MSVRAFALMLFLLPGAAAADPCLDAVAGVDKTADAIDEAQLRDFLDTFRGSRCTAVEYSEWANEAVFALMGKIPEKFFRALRAAGPSVKHAIITRVLDQPIHDLINYPEISNAIESRIEDRELRRYADETFRPYYEEHMRYREWWEKENNATWTYGQ